MTQIELVTGDSIVSGVVMNGHLILTKQSGATVDVGQVAGIQGLQGLTGPSGPTGAPGLDGANGPANTITIGTVTTGPAGSQAVATLTGSAPSQVLNLTIPTGPAGANGSNGSNSSPIVDAAQGVKGVVALSGDLSGTAAQPLLKAVITSGTVGSSTKIPIITYDAAGRVTATSQANLALGVNQIASYAQIPDPTTVLPYQVTSPADGPALYSTGTAWRMLNGANDVSFSTLAARNWYTTHGLCYGGMTCFVGENGLYYQTGDGTNWKFFGGVGNMVSSAVLLQADVGADTNVGMNNFSVTRGIATWNYAFYSNNQRSNNGSWGNIQGAFIPANDGPYVHGLADFFDSGYGLSGLLVRSDGLILQGIKYTGGNGGGGVNGVRGTLSWRIQG